MADVIKTSGHLLDYRFEKLTIACTICARRGVYKVTTLRSVHGNPPLEDLPRLVAMKGGCQAAIRFPGTDCDAHFETDKAPAAITYLAEAYHEGWRLVLQCERSHQGLKSTRPCLGLIHVDMAALVVALGHDFPIDRLNRQLCCLKCGSKQYSLRWVIPASKPTDAGRVAA